MQQAICNADRDLTFAAHDFVPAPAIKTTASSSMFWVKFQGLIDMRPRDGPIEFSTEDGTLQRYGTDENCTKKADVLDCNKRVYLADPMQPEVSSLSKVAFHQIDLTFLF